MDLLSIGTRAVAVESPISTIVEALPDPRIRDAVLTSVHQLAPTQGSGVSRVGISGPGAASATMTTETRRSSKQIISETASRAKERIRAVGIVREIDLDERRFELRQVDLWGSVRCVYKDTPDTEAKAWVDLPVVVSGLAELGKDGLPALLWADTVEALESKKG